MASATLRSYSSAFGSVVARPVATGCATASTDQRTSLPNGTSADEVEPQIDAVRVMGQRGCQCLALRFDGHPGDHGWPGGALDVVIAARVSGNRLVRAVLRSYPRAIGACLAQPRRRRAGSGEQQRVREFVRVLVAVPLPEREQRGVGSEAVRRGEEGGLDVCDVGRAGDDGRGAVGPTREGGDECVPHGAEERRSGNECERGAQHRGESQQAGVLDRRLARDGSHESRSRSATTMRPRSGCFRKTTSRSPPPICTTTSPAAEPGGIASSAPRPRSRPSE